MEQPRRRAWRRSWNQGNQRQCEEEKGRPEKVEWIKKPHQFEPTSTTHSLGAGLRYTVKSKLDHIRIHFSASNRHENPKGCQTMLFEGVYHHLVII